jgi:hypothetical protein
VKQDELIPELLYRSKWLVDSGHLERLRKARRIEAHLDPSNLSRLWVNIDGLKCLELVTNDPHLHELTLLDWLLICGDNKLRGFLSRAREVQYEVNKVAKIDTATREGRRKRREEVKNADKPPTKTEIRRNRRDNTAAEAAGTHPVGGRLLPGGAGVGVVRRAQHGHEDLGAADLAR